jgi:uncharacterized protein YdcH (DUF465 family)
MFEFDQDIVDKLIERNERFARLHTKHRELNSQVDEANAGINPENDLSLERKKKERLFLRDQMAQMIAEYRRSIEMRA